MRRPTALVLLGCVLPLAVWGSADAASLGTAPPTPGPALAGPGSAARCHVADLTVAAGQAQGAAGHVIQVFEFTNVSARTCYLFGYPGMDVLDSSGRPLHVTVVRDGPVVPRTVAVPPRGTASFAASYPNPDDYPRGCPSGPRIEITPPNAYGHLVLAYRMPDCPEGIEVSAVVAGTGGGVGGSPASTPGLPATGTDPMT
jgi:hypothetical protein